MPYKVCLFFQDEYKLKVYKLIFSVSHRFELISAGTSASEVCAVANGQLIDLVIIDLVLLESTVSIDSIILLRRHFPWVRLIVAGVSRKPKDIGILLNMPVRGAIDFDEQGEKEIRLTCECVMKEGHDMSLLKKLYPAEQRRINEYEARIPNLDKNFWRVVPLLIEGKSQTAIAEELHVSRKTVGRWISGYCEKLSVPNIAMLIYTVTANAWWIPIPAKIGAKKSQGETFSVNLE